MEVDKAVQQGVFIGISAGLLLALMTFYGLRFVFRGWDDD